MNMPYFGQSGEKDCVSSGSIPPAVVASSRAELTRRAGEDTRPCAGGVTIGVISTPTAYRPRLPLRGSDYIIHAGDIGHREILTKLAEIAPVTAIRGNVDREVWARKIPPTNLLEVGGTAIYVLHNFQELDLKPEVAGFAAVVYGHSHLPKQEMKNGVLYFNPGSAGPRRFQLPVTIGRLKVQDGRVSGEIVEIVAGAG
jgi:putative phosphoesterase